MKPPEINWSLAVGWGIAACSLGLNVWQAILNTREKRAKQAAEEKLALADRRGQAPFYIPCGERFHHLETGEGMGVFPGEPGVLSRDCHQADPLDARVKTIILPLFNTGEPVKTQVIKMDGEKLVMAKAFEVDRARVFHLLEYPFRPHIIGQRRVLEITFETAKGPWHTHRYETFHGCLAFKRIDPPLPE